MTVEDVRSLQVFVGTFNVGGQKPDVDDADLRLWLFKSKNEIGDFLQLNGQIKPGYEEGLGSPDLLLVGLQEIVELTPGEVINPSAETAKAWEKKIDTAVVRSRLGYVKVATHQLVGLLSLVYIKRELYSNLTDIRVGWLPTGYLGILGNKGAVSVRFDWGSTSVCFVNAHLSAFDNNVAARNADYKAILGSTSWGDSRTILQHDYVFWSGDLNYRINEPNEDVRAAIADGNLAKILPSDQLAIQRQSKLAFEDFEEGPITFPPTYKYDLGTDVFDSGPKKRTPAWTDRVLWRGDAVQLYYGHTPSVLCSDHKPVSALFTITVDPEPKRTVSFADDRAVSREVRQEGGSCSCNPVVCFQGLGKMFQAICGSAVGQKEALA